MGGGFGKLAQSVFPESFLNKQQEIKAETFGRSENLHAKLKVSVIALTAFLTCSFLLLPLATAAGSLILTPNVQAPGGSVSVSGTGFGAAQNVVIAFGNEIKVDSEAMFPVETGPTTRAYNWTVRPIKPGSMHIHLVSITYPGQEYDYYDNGAGRLERNTDGVLLGIVDYALGRFARNATGTPTVNEWTASYICYQQNVTSIGSITTSASGTFSANITIPAVANGNYNITAIDSVGNMARATFSSIPEVLPFGAILLLSSAAVAAGSWRLRKRPTLKY